MNRALKLSSVSLFLFAISFGTLSPGFEPAEETRPISARDEKETVITPKVWVDVFQSNYRPIMPRLAGDHIFYTSLNEKDTRLGCIGRHLYALPIGPVKGSRTETRVATFDCVLQLQSFGEDLYVIHRFTPAKKENSSKDISLTPELRIAKVNAKALKIENDRFSDAIGARGQAAHQVRFAVKMDDLGRERETRATRTSLIDHDKLFVVAETGTDKDRETYLDILDIKKPWSSESSVMEVPIKSRPIADFVVPGPDKVIIALDGGRREMGQILFLSWDGSRLEVTKEVGNEDRLAPNWTESDEEDFAVRRPRFLALTPNGMLGSEKTAYEQQFVFYFSWDDEKVYKVRHLSRYLNQVSGFHFVFHGEEPGLLVADSDDRWIRWYGSKSPFPADMMVHTISTEGTGAKPLPTQNPPKKVDDTLVPEEAPERNK